MRIFKILFLGCTVLLWSGALAAQLRQVAILDIPGRPGFDQVAIANGRLVITHAGAGTVDIFDPAKRRLIARVNGMSEPRGIAVDDKGGRVFIANSGNNTITVLSSEDWMVKDNFKVQNSPDELLFVPEVQTLYASNWHNDSLSAISPQTGEARTVSIDGRPEDMAFDPQSKLLYVSVQDRQQVAVLTPDLNVTTRFKLTASQPTGIAIDTPNRKLFVAVRYAVLTLDIDSGAELSRVACGAGADKLWYDDSGQTLYAASGGGTVTMIKHEGNRYYAEQEMATPVRSHTLAFDPIRKLVYVPGGSEGHSKLVILKRVDNAPARAQAAASLR